MKAKRAVHHKTTNHLVREVLTVLRLIDHEINDLKDMVGKLLQKSEKPILEVVAEPPKPDGK